MQGALRKLPLHIVDFISEEDSEEREAARAEFSAMEAEERNELINSILQLRLEESQLGNRSEGVHVGDWKGEQNPH